jgi:hypothetical protein
MLPGSPDARIRRLGAAAGTHLSLADALEATPIVCAGLFLAEQGALARRGSAATSGSTLRRRAICFGQAVRYDIANVFNPAYSVACRLSKRWLK